MKGRFFFQAEKTNSAQLVDYSLLDNNSVPKSLAKNPTYAPSVTVRPLGAQPAFLSEDLTTEQVKQVPIAEVTSYNNLPPLNSDFILGGEPTSQFVSEGEIKSEIIQEKQTINNVVNQNQTKSLVAASKPNTMEDFLTEAYKNNPEINAARSQLKIVDESLPQAYAGFLPDLSYNLNNTYTKSQLQSSSNSKDFYTNGNNLELRQELFGSGESFYAVKASLNEIEAAQSQLKQAEQRFFQEAITAYVNAIFSSKIYNLSLKNEEILKNQVESTRQRYVVGDATKTDVAQSESRYTASRSATIQSFNDLTITKSDFRRIFGSEIPVNLQMPTQLPQLPSDMNAAMQIALKNNPELNRAFSEKLQRENEVDQVRSQLFPQVDLVASKGERESVSGISLLATEQDTVALNVTVPIYDGGTTYSRVREFQDRRRQASFAYEAQKNTLRDNIVRAWQQVEFTTQDIELNKSSLGAAEFAVQGVREEQKEGARLIQDVLDAERERFQAELGYARAIRDSVLAIYNLKNIMGELTAKELNLSVANYDVKEHFENTKFKLFGF